MAPVRYRGRQSEWEAAMPPPSCLLTWFGVRTTTLRLGTAAIVLPWHNPVPLEEQSAATVDLLSGGRSYSGIGIRLSLQRIRRFRRADR